MSGWSLKRKRTALALLILIPCVGEAQAINFADAFCESVLKHLPLDGWSIWKEDVTAWVASYQRAHRAEK